MKLKTLFYPLFIALVALYFSSCDSTPVSQDETVHIAMLAHGTTFNDMAFLQSCKNGLDRAIVDFDISAEYDVGLSEDYIGKLRLFAGREYDLIIAIGYMWTESLAQAASEYPDTRFILVDAELLEIKPNVTSISFDVDEVAYPLGFLAAWWSFVHNGIDPAVGYVGAMDIPQIRQFTEPYLKGVQRFNHTYSAEVAFYGGFAGSFVDFELGGNIADSLIALGADVMFGVGGQAGNGSLFMAKQHGKWGIGVDVDQYISYPEVSSILLSSAMKRLDNAIYAVIEAFMLNHFPGGDTYTGNLGNQGVAMAPYHDFDSQIPDTIKMAIENIKTGIIQGNISTGW